MKLLSIPSLEVSRTVGACSITTSINDNSVRHLLSSLLPLTSALYKGIRWNADQFGIFRLNPRGLASFASVSICAPVAPKRKYKYTNTQMTRGLASFVDVLICAPVAPKLPAPSNRCHYWPREGQTYLMVTTCSTQRTKNLVGKLALPTEKLLRKTMENVLWSSQTVWKVSGQPGEFPDRLESFWIA